MKHRKEQDLLIINKINEINPKYGITFEENQPTGNLLSRYFEFFGIEPKEKNNNKTLKNKIKPQ